MRGGKRGERRARTISVGRRRRKQHLSRVHPDGVIDCVCEQSVWFFAKKKGLGCDCRRRMKGRPRLANGLGRYNWRNSLYRRRRISRELCLAIVHRALDGDDDRAWLRPRGR